MWEEGSENRKVQARSHFIRKSNEAGTAESEPTTAKLRPGARPGSGGAGRRLTRKEGGPLVFIPCTSLLRAGHLSL